MIWGQAPLVTVLITVTTTPLVGGGATHAFVHVGGSKLQAVPHSTVLLVAQSMVKVQPAAAVTVKGTTHWAMVPALSMTVKVM